VLDGDPAPPKGAQPPIFGLRPSWPNDWMHEDATCNRGSLGLGPREIVSDGDSATPKGAQPLPNFRPMSVVAEWLDGSRCQ